MSENSQDKKTFSIRISPEVHASAKSRAAALGQTLERFIEEALLKAVASDAKKGRGAK